MAAASPRSPPENLARIQAWLLPTLLAAARPAPAVLAASLNISPASGAGGKRVTLSASGFDLDGVGYHTAFFPVRFRRLRQPLRRRPERQGSTNAQDTVLFRALLGLPPGPSGLQP